MPSEALPTRFYGKTWVFVATAIVFGFFTAFSLVCGSLFLLGIIQSADGRPTKEAGITLTIMCLVFLFLFALTLFNALARRRPVIRVCREGIEVMLIGLDGYVFASSFLVSILQVPWANLTLQVFRCRIVRATWEESHWASTASPCRASGNGLRIAAEFRALPDGKQGTEAMVWKTISFSPGDLKAPPELVADTMTFYSILPEQRDQLPGWDE